MIELLKIDTKGNSDMINITEKVEKIIKKADFSDGIVNVFVRHLTAAVTIVENEAGIIQDFKEYFDKLVPINDKYHHNELQEDDNGACHLKASLVGSSVSIPFKNGKMLLGTWQQVFLVDFDTHSREREVVVSLIEVK